MAKITINSIADKYNIDPSVIIKIAQDFKIDVKNEKSSISDIQIKKIERKLEQIQESIRQITGKTSKKVEKERTEVAVKTDSASPHRKIIRKKSASSIDTSLVKAEENTIQEVGPSQGELKTIADLDEEGLKLTEQRVQTSVIRRRKRTAEDIEKEKAHFEEIQEEIKKEDTKKAAEKIPTSVAKPSQEIAPSKKVKEKETKAKEKKETRLRLEDLQKEEKISTKPKETVSVVIEYSGPEKEEVDDKSRQNQLDTVDSTKGPVLYDDESVKFDKFSAEQKKIRETFRPDKGYRGQQGERKVREHYIPIARKHKSKKKTIGKTMMTTPKASKRVIKMYNTIVVGELAKGLQVKANEVIKKLFDMGVMVTINQSIDFDTASIITSLYNYEVENATFTEQDILTTSEDNKEDLVPRPPVVTVMGHVDHGKTSLLDYIRKTNVTAHEQGGITQHIGAYTVTVNNNKEITFIDTPGHAAFTSLRARGVRITDIVILVVAADDGIMPQTREAIDHAKAAKVPIIVAVNKIDLPNANSERVKQGLTEFGLVPEAWGGDVQICEISAKTGMGIPELLESILLQAEVLELKANPKRNAEGVIIESKLDKGRGPVATVLVRNGTLKVGDNFVVGSLYSKIRALLNDKHSNVPEALPGIPVEVLGLPDVPNAGDILSVTSDEKSAKTIAMHRSNQNKDANIVKKVGVSLDEIYQKIEEGKIKDLNIIIKADTQGSAEALVKSYNELSTDKVKINIVHTGVGGITESDVLLAQASNALIVGFNVRPDSKAKNVGEQQKIDIRLYGIIYDAINGIKEALRGAVEPVKKEEVIGHVEVRDIFTIPKIGVVAGGFVQDGRILRSSFVRLIRDSIVIYEGTLQSLRRFKDDVREVAAGYECGVTIQNYNDLKVGDVIESYTIKEVREL